MAWSRARGEFADHDKTRQRCRDERQSRYSVCRGGALDAPALPVHADRKSFQQILVRLVSNASKYSADGGMITLGADRDGSRVRIWVRDTGVGIAQDEMKRVFEPFFQVESGKTRRYSGIGLGLTIARDLARRMEGEVTLASQLGSGTTATVVLPAA
jgi:two-component system, cell cycle sensor histidine kinase DivJ